MADRKNNPVKYGEVVAKCWEDEAYKKRFLEDPEGVLAEAGFEEALLVGLVLPALGDDLAVLHRIVLSVSHFVSSFLWI
ncbi:MAG: hypothetical protein J6N22_01010, partial [Schwartzia sp.]|nr:hypothetical protein [Schwartzia sp. (in: firmicutes)]